MRNVLVCLALFAAAFVPPSAQGAKSAGKPSSKPEATATVTQGNKTLWKEWYILTVNDAPAGVYEETLERRPADKHLAISQKWVEKEEGKTQTYIGSVVGDNDMLAPVAFFSERSGGGSSYKIDGRAKAGKLEMTFRPEKPKGAARKRSVIIDSSVILSNFLPMMLARKAKGTYSFTAVVEDARDGDFDARAGSALVTDVKKSIRGQDCKRSVVEFNGQEGEWWTTAEGKVCEIYIPSVHSRIQLTTEADAKKAFGL